MTTDETSDPILRILSALPPAAPPAAVDQRIRSRCYVALAARHAPAHHTRFAVIAAGVLNAALAIAAGIYAAATGWEALRLAGIL